ELQPEERLLLGAEGDAVVLPQRADEPLHGHVLGHFTLLPRTRSNAPRALWISSFSLQSGTAFVTFHCSSSASTSSKLSPASPSPHVPATVAPCPPLPDTAQVRRILRRTCSMSRRDTSGREAMLRSMRGSRRCSEHHSGRNFGSDSTGSRSV